MKNEEFTNFMQWVWQRILFYIKERRFPSWPYRYRHLPSFFYKILADVSFLFKCFIFPWKKKGYYIGWLGHGNLGDEILKIAIDRIFEKEFILLGHSEGAILRFLKKNGFLKFHFLCLGGGTLINQDPSVLKRILDKSVIKRFVFGTGVTNPIFWEGIDGFKDLRFEWGEVLNTFDFIGVRGPISVKLLRDWGLKKEAQVIGDPVLYFTRPLNRSKQVSRRLGLNFAIPVKNRFWGRDSEQWLNEFSHFVELMLSDGWSIEFLPVWKEDLNEVLLLQKKFGAERIKVFKNYSSLERTLDMLERCDVFVGMKLHSVALAYCANTPAVMVEYRPKCRDFMESINMEKFDIRIDQFDAETAKKYVEEMYKDRESIRIKTNKICLDHKAKLIEASRSVCKIINQ